jgi:threonine dehydrogenase-like Zn-dependent dehydrogenase
MSKNRGVVYTKPGEVQVQDIADPKFEDPRGRKIEHGVILKVVSTNICGSDQHMLRLGLGWSKANSFHTGQTPVLRYNRQLMTALLNDRLPIAKIVNAQAISLEDAPKGYAQFDQGIAAKFVLDPHGLLAKAT